MLASVEITPWHWAGFILIILFFLALDLGVFHRRPHVVPVKEALAWTLFWMALALGFAAMLVPLRGRTEALQFCTATSNSLVDNVFVNAPIFAYFRVPPEFQHRVLVWGVLGAIFMRGLMIGLGAALINRFEWALYPFGAFLVFTGFKMLATGVVVTGQVKPRHPGGEKHLPGFAEFRWPEFLHARQRPPDDHPAVPGPAGR